MTQACIRRVAAAAALATVLTFAAPVQAAGWQTWREGPGWFQAAVHWMARLWTGKDTVDPNGVTTATTPPSGSERGSGIDPDG